MGMGGFSLFEAILFTFIYILPSIIALKKNHKDKLWIILINLFLGLVFGVGWLIALAWCLLVDDKRQRSD